MRSSWLLVLAACKATSSLGYLAPPAADDGRLGLGHLDLHLSRALVDGYRQQIEHAPPPVSLVPSDGGQLELRALAAAVTIEGPLAHTELHFTFHNPEARVREGRFTIALPSGAAVGRFAMRIGDGWREARVVSRDQGRRVYEQVLKRGVDPALLEQDLGNQFSARVFPIAANADKEIVIAYDHAVSALRPYTLALAGLPAIPVLAIAIDRDGVHQQLARGGGAPVDLVLAVPAGSDAVTGGDAFVARLETPEQQVPAVLDRVMLLVDTSASRAPVMGRQAELVRHLVDALPADTAIVIAAFDQAVTELYRGPARDGARAEDALLSHGALGGSDLGGALTVAAASGMRRLVVIGDGAPTLGEADRGKLAAAAHGLERIDAVQVGTSIDRETLALVVAQGAQPGAILDGGDAARVVHQLATTLAPERAIRVDGATASWPATTRGVAPGEPVWVFGTRAGDGALAIHVGDRLVSATPHPALASHVSRAVAGAQLVALGEQLDRAAGDDRAPLAAQIEAVALAHDLVSSRTSLLVLESDADEQRLLGPAAEPMQATPPPPAEQALTFDLPKGETTEIGEVIRVVDTAPMTDPTTTTQGITIDRNYLRNLPVPGRTFEAALAAGAGAQGDGVSFTGSTSLDHSYTVDSPRDALAPYTGTFRDVMTALAHRDRGRALELAARWQLANPGDVAAIVALGEALEARGATTLAARAYCSLLDLFPRRADLLRAAGERLDRIPGARPLAIDAYRRAIAERPDHLSTYRLLAYDLLRDARDGEAIELLTTALGKPARPSILQILRDDRAIIAGHLLAGHPSERRRIVAQLGGEPLTRPALRITLSWETDANDVDLHVYDSVGGHSSYASKQLPSGGALLDDVTDGFGPERFEVDQPKAFPYRIGAVYFNMGPMGFGMGSVQVIRTDGAGGVTIEDRPFLLQTNGGTVELGTVAGP